jgi:hypothetical protein
VVVLFGLVLLGSIFAAENQGKENCGHDDEGKSLKGCLGDVVFHRLKEYVIEPDRARNRLKKFKTLFPKVGTL